MKRVLLAGVLSALGFSCTECVQRDMYGCPYADFEVKGRVTGAENAPLKGIKVSVRTEKGESAYAVSDENGKYGVGMETTFAMAGSVWVKAEDIDGEAGGGSFAADSVEVAVVPSDYKGGGEWYEGKATKNVDFILEKDK